MTGKLTGKVVVVTGATSGIGRATALACAREGARVVLAARRERALGTLVEECERAGARALAVPTDVTGAGAVEALAARATSTFGRIDAWVNNAAVTLFGRVEETPAEAWRRVIDVNLVGYMHGARAVIPVFREQGGGVLVNVSSIVGLTGQPFTSAYVASKHGIRGLSESLRMETRDAGIHVCTVLPASIDTPIFQNAGNYTGTAVKPMPPVYEAEQVADAIVNLVRHPKREVMVGNAGRAVKAVRALAPPLGERLMARNVQKAHFRHGEPEAPNPGNLFEPGPHPATVSGGWREDGKRPKRGRVVATALVAGAALAWWSLSTRGRERKDAHA